MKNQKNSKKKNSLSQESSASEFKKEDSRSSSQLKKKPLKGSAFKKSIFKKPQINRDIENKTKELEELQKNYRYLQAEFANFKRIAQKEQEKAIKYSSFHFLQDIILNFLNDFNRAMEKNWESKNFEDFKKGVEMLHSKFIQILKQHGAAEIAPSKGVLLDPNLHEVVGAEAGKEHPENTILHICRTGYQLHDRLVQAAQVIVSKNDQDEQGGG